MSSRVNLGYASRRSASVAPSASLRRSNSTGMRVPRITGLPIITFGSISIRSVTVTATPPLRPTTFNGPVPRVPLSLVHTQCPKLQTGLSEHRPGRRGRGSCRPLPAAHQRARRQCASPFGRDSPRSEEHTSELQSQFHLVCRLLLEKKKI